MAMQRPNQAIGAALPVQTPVAEPVDAEMETEAEEELEKLEAEVKDMADKILHHRSKLPDQLKDAISLLATVHRPDSDGVEAGSELGPAGASRQGLSGNSEPGEGSSLSERDRETAEKIELLKEKTSKNFSTIPVLLKRMKDCVSTIDSLNSRPGTIHPAFKKTRTS